MIDAHGNNLAFLLSTPRAGSTLLSVMLGRHSQIHSPNEPWFLLPLLDMYQDQVSAVSAYDQKAATLAIKELLDEKEFCRCARAFGVSVYNSQLDKARKSIFLDKTPRYYHMLPAIDATFPAAKKIWLKRNPLDVAASFVSTWNIPLPELIGERMTPSSFDLTLSLFKFIQFFAGQPGVLELKYEDVVADPEKHLKQLCHFLGVLPEPELANYASQKQALDSLRRTTMGDKKILDHSKPHQQSIGQWRKVLSREEVQLLLDWLGRGPFERMGYNDVLETLDASGYKFPSQKEADERANLLEQRAHAFPFSSPNEITLLDDAQKALKKLRRHWWFRLGRAVGACRVSSI